MRPKRGAEPGAGSEFRPIRLVDLDVASAIPPIEAHASSSGMPYGAARALVRVHGEPVATVALELNAGGCSAESCAGQIWLGARLSITTHLERDGLEAPERLTAAGIPFVGPATCEIDRIAFAQAAPSMTVVIPTRDRPLLLTRCLESILSGSYPLTRLEIIVVDNAPTSVATLEVVRSFRDRGYPLRYVREDRSGSASARNAALPLVEGEIVAFTDDDVTADRDWILELARGYAATSGVDCVTGMVVPSELETPAQIWFEQYGGFSLGGFEQHVYDLVANRGTSALYPYAAGIYGTGNSMSFRRSALADIGSFDPTLGNGTPALGGVDSEMLLRTVLRGHRLVYRPQSVVHHRHRRDYASLRRQVYSYGVGLTAYLTKTVVADPRVALAIARRLPRGAAYALRKDSLINEKKTIDYPSELSRVELRGMLYGPIAYARSRLRERALGHAG